MPVTVSVVEVPAVVTAMVPPPVAVVVPTPVTVTVMTRTALRVRHLRRRWRRCGGRGPGAPEHRDGSNRQHRGQT